MKIVDKAVKRVYRLSCPNCGSRLEADIKDMTDIGGRVSKFYCPVCKEERYISWSELRKRTIYEGGDTQ